MNAAQALLKLLESLAILGYNRSSLSIIANEHHGDDQQVEVGLPVGEDSLTVTICRYWDFPGCACYFVNYRSQRGDFIANSGTPHIEQCLVNIGHALGMAAGSDK